MHTESAAPSGEKILTHAVMTLLIKNGRANLPVKKQKIGAGFRNGYGGGIEVNEDPFAAACRECLEEGGIKVWREDLTRVALLTCHNRTERGEAFTCAVHVFRCDFWLGTPRESDEMGPPQWYPFDELPVPELMLGDREWLPRLVSGLGSERLLVEMWYGPHQESLDATTIITAVPALPDI